MSARDDRAIAAPARTPELRRWFLGALALGAGVTLAAAASPEGLARHDRLALLLFAGSAFAALAAAGLMLQRYFHGRSAADAGLVLASCAIALAGFGGFASLSSPGAFGPALLGSGALAGAAFLACALPAHAARASHSHLAVAVAVGAGAVALTLLDLSALPAAAVFFATALGFTARAYSRRDSSAALYAATAILGLYASLDRVLVPPAGSGASAWLMLGCSALLLASATLGARRSWEERALQETRRRLARRLHDGLAQELAFLVLEGKRGLQAATGDPLLGELVETSERALDETRHVIATLRRPAGTPFGAALAREAHEVAARLGLEVEIESDELEVAEDAEDALLLVAREALALAATECGAAKAFVTLTREGGPALRVRHDGSAARRELRALGSLERRAGSIGASVRLLRLPRGGLVEVSLP